MIAQWGDGDHPLLRLARPNHRLEGLRGQPIAKVGEQLIDKLGLKRWGDVGVHLRSPRLEHERRGFDVAVHRRLPRRYFDPPEETAFGFTELQRERGELRVRSRRLIGFSAPPPRPRL